MDWTGTLPSALSPAVLPQEWSKEQVMTQSLKLVPISPFIKCDSPFPGKLTSLSPALTAVQQS